MSYNRQFKDSLFRALFGREENKENLLSLYNALNHTHYTDVNDLTLNTIDDVIYMSVKNDVSCLIDDHMSLYEHQSSFNPNMPIRGLIYFSKLYEKYFELTKFNRFSRRLIHLPMPRYYVFYNGTEERPDREVLLLSDAFEPNGRTEEKTFENEPCLECAAIMLNINYGHNKELMERCGILTEYALLVEKCREYAIICEKEEAVRRAVRDCISEGILKDFLLIHETEVVDMFLTDYNEEETMEMFKKEFYEDGFMKGEQAGFENGQKAGIDVGINIGRKEIVLAMLAKTGDINLVSELTGMSTEEIGRLKNEQ